MWIESLVCGCHHHKSGVDETVELSSIPSRIYHCAGTEDYDAVWRCKARRGSTKLAPDSGRGLGLLVQLADSSESDISTPDCIGNQRCRYVHMV